mgnify:CR=1 FL=1
MPEPMTASNRRAAFSKPSCHRSTSTSLEEFICEADKVVVTGHLRLTARSTGREIESDFVHVITVADGKWLLFRDFMNTVEAANAFSS